MLYHFAFFFFFSVEPLNLFSFFRFFFSHREEIEAIFAAFLDTISGVSEFIAMDNIERANTLKAAEKRFLFIFTFNAFPFSLFLVSNIIVI